MLAKWVISLARPLSFRGKHRLLSLIAPTEGGAETRVFGYQMKVDLADFIQRSIYLATYEPAEVATFRSLLAPGMTFVDVGANVGFFSLLAASAVGPTGRVVAVEPSPYAVDRLREAVAANDLQCVDVVSAGLSERDGTLPLFVPATAGNHTPTMTAAGPDTVRIDVPVTTLDRLLGERSIERVDVLKVDVEGHEPRVFAGGEQALRAGVVRDIVCEFNEPWLREAGSSGAALDAFLRGVGFADLTARNRVLRRGMNRHYRWVGPRRT
jgi:FkbM family methyltransferase